MIIIIMKNTYSQTRMFSIIITVCNVYMFMYVL